ncbi:MAG: VWA domain-containing protein [Deltaproteobacteria bacterium]|nr:VWA domain-containing protein [Deltaproteobacteria bacterium]
MRPIIISLLLSLAPSFAAAQDYPDCAANALIVLDRSFSMNAEIEGKTKLNIAKDAIKFMVTQFDGQIIFGLMVYPGDNSCGDGIMIAEMPAKASDIEAALDAIDARGQTPIPQAMQAARDYFISYLPTDPVPRASYVILLTDGKSNCGGENPSIPSDPVPAVQALRNTNGNDIKTYVIGFGDGVDPQQLTAIANAGGTGSPFLADNQQSLESALSQIFNSTQAELCDGWDNDCDTGTKDGSQDPMLNQSCDTGQQGQCGAGHYECQNGGLICIADMTAQPELCDGKDSDCDPTSPDGADEPNLNKPCDTGESGICAAGKWKCTSGHMSCIPNRNPEREVCDNVDNDCNQNTADGQDDPKMGTDCATGLPGICAAGSYTDCTNGKLVCTSKQSPSTEICDNLDNDCDPNTPDGSEDPELNGTCSTGMGGVCESGHKECVNGGMVCYPDNLGSAELCNNQDDDCDGSTSDDGTDEPWYNQSCDTGEFGRCKDGRYKCVNGAKVCVRRRNPRAEVCNGQDDDCDGDLSDDADDDTRIGRNCNTGLPGICSAGTYTSCVSGHLVCEQINQPEPTDMCDGRDEDCNPNTPDGSSESWFMQPCATGMGGTCEAGTDQCIGGQRQCIPNNLGNPELCNGEDDDCDGDTSDDGEDDPDMNKDCDTGLPGVCQQGTYTKCTNGKLECEPKTEASTEVCDGKDNDCDPGTADGAQDPMMGQDCDTGKPGICAAGTYTACENGHMVCSQNEQPGAEVCDGIDNDCDPSTKDGADDAMIGQACKTGLGGVCEDGKYNCSGGKLVCVADNLGKPDLCDGVDNDCNPNTPDGTDEPDLNKVCDTGEPGVCSAGNKKCVSGKMVCIRNNDPSLEICDGKDNDCDPKTQDGAQDPKMGQDCDTGKPGVCGPGTYTKCENGKLVCTQKEQAGPDLCDGLDNDCNPKTADGKDEADLYKECDTGLPGGCKTGRFECRDGTMSCESVSEMELEVCDGIDNDCDPDTEDGSWDPLIGQDCDTGLPGICTVGVYVGCVNAHLVCQQKTFPEQEICDGLDNDCDPDTPDGAQDSEVGKFCTTGKVGVCEAGHTVCDSGSIFCDQYILESPEICDGLDNDCDGHVDEGVINACGWCGMRPDEVCDGIDNDCDGIADEGDLCPGTETCINGKCVETCTMGECPAGQKCDSNGHCIDEPCADYNCPEGTYCKAEGDKPVCIDPCKGISCKDGWVCRNGVCIQPDCYYEGCEQGERCIDGSCVPDPCYTKECNQGEFCRDGVCVPSCADVSCDDGKKCVDGSCVDDPCFGADCEAGEICNPATGECEGDPCAGIYCTNGKKCVDGVCVHDICHNIECPDGQRCDNGQCVKDLCRQALRPWILLRS